jgi:hypothetical protein
MLVGTFLSLFLVALGTSQTGGSMPRTLRGDGNSTVPVWVSAAESIGKNGNLNPALFVEAELAGIQAMLTLEPINGCIPVGPIINEYFPRSRDRQSLQNSLRTAEMVVAGTVTGIEPGFYAGEPGSLVRIKRTELLKGQTREALFYVFIPVGRIPVGSKVLCKTDPAYPVAIRLGQDVLFLGPSPMGPDRRIVPLENADDLLLQQPDGTLRLPKQFLASDPSLSSISATSLVQRMRRIVSEGVTAK